MMRWTLPCSISAPALALALGLACTAAKAAGPWLVAPAGPGDAPVAPWHPVGLPAQTKPATQFSVVSLDGKRVLRIEASASYGNLVHPLQEAPGAHKLSWRWRLDEAIPGADLRRREGDDSPIKVCALFDLPLQAVPFVERQVLRVARMRSGDVLPAASVCYVWDAHLAPGTLLDNAFTRRVRMVVLRGPEAPLQTWVNETRDLWADFKRLFGDEADSVPPLVGIAVGADADNTQSHSLAYLATITLD